MDKSKAAKLRQTTTAVQIRKRREMRGQQQQLLSSHHRNSADMDVITGETRFRRAHSSEWDSSGGQRDDFHTNTSGRSYMQTLDKRISASIDQLDSLRDRREAPRFRSSHKILRDTDLNCNDVIFKYKGENYSKNQYFFGETKQKEQKEEPRKTPFEMFLEDDGPYSRKLFGPVQPNNNNNNNNNNSNSTSTRQISPQSSDTTTRDRCSMKNLIGRSREMDSYEEEDGRGRMEGFKDPVKELVREEEEGDQDAQHAVRKGVLWQQRDRLFSRWKERFIVLTRDYLHCFKRGTTRPSEMGDFIFKVKLLSVEGVSLLDKRGYLTVCLCILKEGRIYLRSTQGIRDWFQAIQSTMQECKRRRRLWIRQPNFTNPWDQQTRDEDWREDKKKKKKEENKVSSSGQLIPKGINRLSLVSDLLMSEAITSITSRKEVVEDSGHDSGQSSMNTESSSESEKSGQWSNNFKDVEKIKMVQRSSLLVENFTASRV